MCVVYSCFRHTTSSIKMENWFTKPLSCFPNMKLYPLTEHIIINTWYSWWCYKLVQMCVCVFVCVRSKRCTSLDLHGSIGRGQLWCRPRVFSRTHCLSALIFSYLSPSMRGPHTTSPMPQLHRLKKIYIYIMYPCVAPDLLPHPSLPPSFPSLLSRIFHRECLRQ